MYKKAEKFGPMSFNYITILEKLKNCYYVWPHKFQILPRTIHATGNVNCRRQKVREPLPIADFNITKKIVLNLWKIIIFSILHKHTRNADQLRPYL